MNLQHTHPSWTVFRKTVFRFLFIFILLEILLSVDFIGILCGFNTSVILWGNRIYTPPFLWLNDTVFHFHYNPYQAYTFTPTLTLVRFLTFSGIAAIGCLAWSVADRTRPDYNTLDFWFRQFLCLTLSCVMWGYGVLKIFYVQMPMPRLADLHAPLGSFHPTELLWAAFGYGTPYQIFIGAGEAMAAILLLFRKTRPAGTLIALSILANVAIMNYTYAIGILGFVLFLMLIATYLLSAHAKPLWSFFTSDNTATQLPPAPNYQFTSKWKTATVTGLGVLAVAASYFTSAYRAHQRYDKRRDNMLATRYFEVKTFILDTDTLHDLVLNDTVRWRFWEENSSNQVVTTHTMNASSTQRFAIERDSVNKVLTLKPLGGDATTFRFLYQDAERHQWKLSGNMNGRQIEAYLREVDPYSSQPLFQAKRSLISIDPEQW
jgi:hypothetical protein